MALFEYSPMPFGQPAPAAMAEFCQEFDGSWTAFDDGLTLKTAFQPIFAKLKNGQLQPVACEGLLRVFANEIRVSPVAYFGSLEGPQHKMGETTARTLHIRNAATLPPAMRRLFVNFDPSLLGNPVLFDTTVKQIARELRDAKVPATHVICEITEQAVTDPKALKDIVSALRGRGYLVAVDDFGADASDAARVAQVKPDIVKIDGRKVEDHMQTPQAYTALCRLVESFHDQGIRVVLEGLEKPFHVTIALNSGADFFQGFALAKPQLAPARFETITNATNATLA